MFSRLHFTVLDESPGSNSVCGWQGSACTVDEEIDPDLPNEGWRVIGGSVTFEDVPICAAALAIGRHGFSRNPCEDERSLSGPLDRNGRFNVFAFAHGFQSHKETGKSLH